MDAINNNDLKSQSSTQNNESKFQVPNQNNLVDIIDSINKQLNDIIFQLTMIASIKIDKKLSKNIQLIEDNIIDSIISLDLLSKSIYIYIPKKPINYVYVEKFINDNLSFLIDLISILKTIKTLKMSELDKYGQLLIKSQIIIDSLIKLVSSYESVKIPRTDFFDELKDFIKSLIDVLNSLHLCGLLVTSLLNSVYLKLLKTFVEQIQSLIGYITQKFTDDITKGLTAAAEGIKQLIYIITELLILNIIMQFATGQFMLYIAYAPVMLIFLKSLKFFFKYVTKLFDEEFSEKVIKAQKAIEATKTILKNLLIESALVNAMLLLLPTTIVGLIIAIVYVRILGVFLKQVDKAIRSLGDIDIDDIVKKISSGKSIIKELIKLAGWIMILAVVAIPAMIMVLIVILYVLELRLLMTTISNIFNKIDVVVIYRNIKKLEQIILLLGLISLTLILITPLVVAAMVVLLIITLFILELKFALNLLNKTLTNIVELYDKIKILEKLFLMIGLVALTLILITPLVVAAMVVLLIIILFILELKFTLNLLNKLLTNIIELYDKIKILEKIFLMIGLVALTLILITPLVVASIVSLGIIILFTLLLRITLNFIHKELTNVKVVSSNLIQLTMLILLIGLTALSLILITPFVVASILTFVIIWLFTFMLKIILNIMIKVFNSIQITQIYKGTAKLQSIALCLLLISLSLILLAPALILGMISMLIVVLFVGVLSLLLVALKYLFGFIDKLITIKLVIGILKIVGLLVIFMIITLIMIQLGKKSIQALTYMVDILKFLGMFIGVTLFIVGIGYLASLMAPVIIGAIVGLGLILIIIGIVILMAWVLTQLFEIEFDYEKITEKINQIMNAALSIIDSVFESPVSIDSKTNEKNDEQQGSWIERQLKSLGSGLFMVMKIILVIPFLFFTLLAIGFMLLIAGALRLLQMINLNVVLINTNVDIVLTTADQVIASIFNRQDPEPNEGEKKDKNFGDWIIEKLQSMVPGIFKVIEMLLSVVYLFFVFIAITLILAIVGALKLLQSLELDSAKIYENITIVMDSAEQVIASVFNRPDPEPNESEKKDKGFGDWIIEMLAGVVPGLFKVIELIISIMYLFFVFIAVGMIASIVKSLNEIAGFNLQKTNIESNVGTIFEVADAVITKVFEQKEKHGDKQSNSTTTKILNWLGVDPIISTFISANAYLSYVFESIGMIGEIVESLNKVAGFSLKKEQVTTGVDVIFDTVDTLIARVFDNDITEDKLDDLEDIVDELPEVMEAIAESADELSKTKDITLQCQYVKTMIDMFNRDIVPFTDDKQKRITKTINQLITSSNGLAIVFKNFNKYNLTKTGDNLKYLIDIISQKISKDTIDEQARSIKNFIKLLDKIDGVDIANLKTAVRLFENMSKFSESINGNFQGLADALNEKIAPLLEELKDLLKEVKPSIEQASKDTQASITYNATGNTERAAQLAGMPQEQVQQVRQTEENKKRANYERLAAIDKIVKLLEGEYKNGAKVRMS